MYNISIWMFPKNRGKTPKMDDFGVPLFLETPIFASYHNSPSVPIKIQSPVADGWDQEPWNSNKRAL